MIKHFKLPYDLNIFVHYDKNGDYSFATQTGGGSTCEDDSDDPFDVAISTLEATALAHACAGIDIEDPKYIEGMQTMYDKIENKFGDD